MFSTALNECQIGSIHQSSFFNVAQIKFSDEDNTTFLHPLTLSSSFDTLEISQLIILSCAEQRFSRSFSSWTTMTMPPYSRESSSIYRLNVNTDGQFDQWSSYSPAQCLELSRSPLERQCRLLQIQAEEVFCILVWHIVDESTSNTSCSLGKWFLLWTSSKGYHQRFARMFIVKMDYYWLFLWRHHYSILISSFSSNAETKLTWSDRWPDSWALDSWASRIEKI